MNNDLILATNVRDWQRRYANHEYDSKDRRTQCNAGWFDWFCNDEDLAEKTDEYGRLILDIKDGGKIDLDRFNVWFKNNCPCVGPLYDDIRFSDGGENQFVIAINDEREEHAYVVYTCRNDFKSSIYGTDDVLELINWLNTPETEN